MNDLSNPFAASMFLAAHKTFMASTGRSVRRFVASFVFAAASGLVLIGTAEHVVSSYQDDEAAVAEQMRPSAEYLAARSALEAEWRAEDAAQKASAEVEASAR